MRGVYLLFENSKNGHYFVKDLVAFSSAPSHARSDTEQALHACLCNLGDRQWNPHWWRPCSCTNARELCSGTFLTSEIFFTQFCCKRRVEARSYRINSHQSQDAGTLRASPTHPFCSQPEPLHTCLFWDSWEDPHKEDTVQVQRASSADIILPIPARCGAKFPDCVCAPSALSTRRK